MNKNNLEALNTQDEFYFQWHFLEQCNLRCVHCYQEEYGCNELSRENSFAIAEIMKKTLKKWNKFGRISLTGGEPFLQKDLLVDLVDFFNRSDQFSRIGVLTNGTLIDDAIASRLKPYDKLHEIQVSIDGSNASIHDQIRGIGCFAKAIKGIQLFC